MHAAGSNDNGGGASGQDQSEVVDRIIESFFAIIMVEDLETGYLKEVGGHKVTVTWFESLAL
jgi:hypothetical protein